MTAKLWLKDVNLADLTLSITLLLILWRRGKVPAFKFFVAYLVSRVVASMVSIPLLFYRTNIHLSVGIAWPLYWWTYYFFFTFQVAFQTLALYEIYRLAMKPLPGLQRIGQIIFRWVAGVSFGLSILFAISPQTTGDYWAVLIEQTHQGTSALALCLLFFVCLAIRPLGLTFRSQIFGVSLGLGVTSLTTLIEASWFPTDLGHKLYSPVFLVAGVASLVALCIWLTYFGLPEPERKMVLLPTTSPFFMWNSISEALGDDPGFVAVSGFTPDMLSEAEIEEMSRSAHHDELRDGSEGSDSDDNDEGDDVPPSPHALMKSLLSSETIWTGPTTNNRPETS